LPPAGGRTGRRVWSCRCRPCRRTRSSRGFSVTSVVPTVQVISVFIVFSKLARPLAASGDTEWRRCVLFVHGNVGVVPCAPGRRVHRVRRGDAQGVRGGPPGGARGGHPR